MTSSRIAKVSLLALWLLAACGAGATTRQDSAIVPEDSTIAPVEDEANPLTLSGRLLGERFEGLYVSPDVRIEDLAGSGTAVALTSPFDCDELWLQLVSGDWELVDQLTTPPVDLTNEGSTSSFVRAISVLRSGEAVATLTVDGVSGCSGVLTSGLPGAEITMPGVDTPTMAWAATTACQGDENLIRADVEIITDNGAGASLRLTVLGNDSMNPPLQLIGGYGSNGWLRTASGLYAAGEAFVPATGDVVLVANGNVKIELTARQPLPSGTVTVSGTAQEMSGASGGPFTLTFPFSCTSLLPPLNPFG